MRIPAYRGHSGRGVGVRLPMIALVIIGIAIYWFSNQQEGLTGRNQMITMDLAQEVAMGEQAYMQILQGETVLCAQGARAGASACPADAGPVVELVRGIGERIAAAAIAWEREGAPMTILGETEGSLPSWGAVAEGFDWQFNVIASDTPNAFALPGGYVAFYTGILPTAGNDDGLAVIMGHEVAHALARHGAERMSQQQVMQFGQLAIGASVADLPVEQQRAIMGALGMGAQLGVLLPYSRQHETEADLIGLELMIRACFDPREAPRLWERMAALGGEGGRPPEIVSTHPDPAARARAFEELMPRAVELYEQRCGPLPPE
jgi:predicted Zn-dependent protease